MIICAHLSLNHLRLKWPGLRAFGYAASDRLRLSWLWFSSSLCSCWTFFSAARLVVNFWRESVSETCFLMCSASLSRWALTELSRRLSLGPLGQATSRCVVSTWIEPASSSWSCSYQSLSSLSSSTNSSSPSSRTRKFLRLPVTTSSGPFLAGSASSCSTARSDFYKRFTGRWFRPRPSLSQLRCILDGATSSSFTLTWALVVLR